MRKLLILENVKLQQLILSYALWSDGVIEKMVTKSNRVVFYAEVIPPLSREDDKTAHLT